MKHEVIYMDYTVILRMSACLLNEADLFELNTTVAATIREYETTEGQRNS